jgi:hypothetical protein
MLARRIGEFNAMCLIEVVQLDNSSVEIYRLKLGDTDLVWVRFYNQFVYGKEMDRFEGTREECDLWLSEFKREIVVRAAVFVFSL